MAADTPQHTAWYTISGLTQNHTIQYNTIQCGYLVPPIHETGPGGITMVIKCV